MNHEIRSLRTFIGSKNYAISREFYLAMGFQELVTSEKMSYFYSKNFGFYLQDYYVQDWIDNSMVFMEVANLDHHYTSLNKLGLKEKFKGVRISKIVHNDWGSEYFVHDPSGVLWHIGTFKET